MMDHRRRVQLADEITGMLLRKYRSEILLGGMYGSTARGTDTEYSDLEMMFIVENGTKARSVNFTFEGIPVEVNVKRFSEIEEDIRDIELDWPLKLGRLFNLKVTCGDPAILEKLRDILNDIPLERFDEFIASETPLCYEGLGRLKSVEIRGNIHEAPLFVMEVLMEFMLLIAIFNREFINHDYLGGLRESFEFERLPPDYRVIAGRLMNLRELELGEIVSLADRFVRNFVEYMGQNGIKVKEHTPLEGVNFF